MPCVCARFVIMSPFLDGITPAVAFPSLQLRALSSPCLSFLVTQQPAENLAAGAFWDGLDELNPSLEPLVVGLVITNVLYDLCRDLLVAAGRH